MNLVGAVLVRLLVVVPLAAFTAAAYAVWPSVTRLRSNKQYLDAAQAEVDYAEATGLPLDRDAVDALLANVDTSPLDWSGVVERAIAASLIVVPIAVVVGWVLLAIGARRTLRDTLPTYQGWVMPNEGHWWAYGRVGPVKFVQTDPDAEPVLGPTLGIALWRTQRAWRERAHAD